jgi:type III secretion protein N (ATPase)
VKRETFERLKGRLENLSTMKVRGTVTRASGLTIHASLPGAKIGDLAVILSAAGRPVRSEVVGFEQSGAILMPLGRMEGIGAGDEVELSDKSLQVPCGDGLVGRILDGFGEPMDGRALPPDVQWRAVHAAPPSPLTRRRIRTALPVGIKVIDGLLTLGEGQRVGLMAGSGVGKSTLIGQMARSTGADVTVVGLIGERGREVREFIEECLGPGLARSVLVCSTGDAPPMERYKAGLTATTIAEHFREEGRRVLLLVDSVTRLARALREIGLAAGEAPARRGFPPSVFARLPELLERSGNSERGTMTAVYTVLTEGDDMQEPVTDEVRGILDGHIVLARRIAERGLWPAVDPLQSISRVMGDVVSHGHAAAARWLTATMAVYEQNRDMIEIGAYRRGSDRAIDRAIRWMGEIEGFIRQARDEIVPFDETLARLEGLWKRALEDDPRP